MRAAIGMVISLVLIPATGCHWVFPHHPAVRDGGQPHTERPRADGARGDRGDSGRPCSAPEHWTCDPGTMPPKCTLTCGDRIITCSQMWMSSSCTCTVGGQPCGTPITFASTSWGCEKTGLMTSACWTAFGAKELGCCR